MPGRRRRSGLLTSLPWALAALLVCLGAPTLEIEADDKAAESLASKILSDTGVRGGLIVHVGCGDPASAGLTTALRANDRFLVHGLDRDPANIKKARARIRAKKLCGKVSVELWRGDRLPYVDNLVNLLVADSAAGVPMDEILRVVAPGGVAYLRKGGQWTKTVKPRPEDTDEWTHFLHDASGNAVAADTRVGPPRHMQWLAEPDWCRYHHTLASISALVSARDRIFYILDEGPAGSMNVPARWFVAGRDAYNGVLLWKRPIASWSWYRRGFRSGPVQLPRTLVADDRCVYLPLGLDAPVTALNPATGETVRTYPGTERTEEIVLHDGVLLVVTGSPVAEQAVRPPKKARRKKGKKKAKKQAEKEPLFDNEKIIHAIQADTGKALWQWSEAGSGTLMPLTLAAAGERVFFQDGDSIACLNLKTGKELWRSAPTDGGRGRAFRGPGWSVVTLVVHGDVVLWANGKQLSALSAKTGDLLWHCDCKPGFKSPTDVLVAACLVWLGPDFSEGRDPRTGEVKKTNDLIARIQSAGHHHRCYRNKATERYILAGKRGIELLDLVADNHSRNNWVRGLCQYGIMPCNGLLYAPSHACGCYMEAKLYGFWALSAATEPAPQDTASADRLIRGPAYGGAPQSQAAAPQPSDWPTYRHDPRRSGSTPVEMPAQLKPVWTADIGGRLSAPVVAEGIAVVSAVDVHRVVALDARDGKTRWTFTAGGRVDSPPTIHQGLVLFGCTDGWVYCLRGTDGKEAWRFRAASGERCTVACDQIESVWPVHGSVLVDNGVAYVAAGRSSYLDGGIRVYGLNPKTGEMLHEARICSEHPKPGAPPTEEQSKIASKDIVQNTVDYKTLTAPDRSDSFSMAGGATTDVLVSDGTSVYLRQVRFNRDLERQEQGGRHLFSTTRLLDGEEVHRSHWMLGTADFSRIPVAYSWIVNPLRSRWGVRPAVPYGVLLAFDSQTAWGVRRWRGYTLYAHANTPFSADETPLPDFRPSGKGKDEGGPTWQWSETLALRPRAMVHAGKRLFLGGAPTVTKAPESFPAFEGERNGLLWVVSAEDGKKLTECRLDSPPVWDGMAAANGRLYIAARDGRVVCLGDNR